MGHLLLLFFVFLFFCLYIITADTKQFLGSRLGGLIH